MDRPYLFIRLKGEKTMTTAVTLFESIPFLAIGYMIGLVCGVLLATSIRMEKK